MADDLSEDEKKVKDLCDEKGQEFVRSFVRKGKRYPASCRNKKKSSRKPKPAIIESPRREIETPVTLQPPARILRKCNEDDIKIELIGFLADKDLKRLHKISELAKKNGISDYWMDRLAKMLMETYGKDYDIEEMIDIMKSYQDRAGDKIREIAEFIEKENKKPELVVRKRGL